MGLPTNPNVSSGCSLAGIRNQSGSCTRVPVLIQVSKIFLHKHKLCQIHFLNNGPCPSPGESDGTESPIRRWTGMNYFTEPGDDGIRDGFGSGMKSTRHLPQSKQDNFYKNFYNHRSPTSATVQVGQILPQPAHT